LGDSVSGVYFAGRLGTYRYYNMDQVTAQALTLHARLTGKQKSESISAHTKSQFVSETSCALMMGASPD
jgi:hypothetical protein